MARHSNVCSRCGQALELVEEPFSEYKSITDKNNNELCLRCYQDMCDRGY